MRRVRRRGARPRQRERDWARQGIKITWAQYQRLLGRQGGKCWICGASPRRALAVDHDHRTGMVRGLLCSRCNKQLGWWIRDRVEVARRVVRYLERSRRRAAAPPSSGYCNE